MIFAIPGMGADRRAFPGAWQELEDVTFVEWTNYLKFRSIPELAERIVEAEGIRDDDSIIGFSLGGMVGCEISKQRRIEKLVLVASATGADEISGMLSALKPLAPYAPIRLLQALSASMPGEFARMAEDADAGFIRAMCTAICEWQGLGAAHPGMIRIHGWNDLVILPPRNADLMLYGGHLLAMTHATECVEFLEQTEPSIFHRPGGQLPA